MKKRFNKSLYALSKLFLCSLYGRTLMRNPDSEHTIVTHDELQDILRSDTPLRDFEELDPDHWIVVKATQSERQTHWPSSCGAFILAGAQTRLYQVFEEVWRVGGRVLGCDTDGAMIALPPEAALDPAWLSPDEFGLLKWEVTEEWGEIVMFVGVAPKTYAFRFEGGGAAQRVTADGRTSQVLDHIRSKGCMLRGNEDRMDAGAYEDIVDTDASLEVRAFQMKAGSGMSLHGVKGTKEVKGADFDKRKRLPPSTWCGAEYFDTRSWTAADWEVNPLLKRPKLA